MKKICDILFEMLRASVFEADAPEKFAELNISEEELEALYRLAQAHDLAHLVGFALQKNESVKGYPVIKKIQKAHLLSVYRRERIDWEYHRLCEFLEAKEISYIPLKGALLRLLYPETWMRTSSDIDILVKPQVVEEVASALKAELSYEEKGPRLGHDIPLFSPGGIHFELHYCLREEKKETDEILDTVWEHSAPEEGSAFRYRMEEEFFLFYHIAHAALHFKIGGCGIRPFIDLQLLRQKISYDEEKLLSLMKKASLLAFYENCIHLSEVWFGKACHTEITREMEDYLLGGGVYGNVENRIAMSQSKKKGKLRYFWNRIFMPFSSLSRYYPKLKEYPVLYPFYQGKRWIRILFGESRKRALQEFQRNAEIDETKVDRTAILRKDLGLE